MVGDDQNAADLMQQLHTVICLDVSGRIAVKEFQPPIALAAVRRLPKSELIFHNDFRKEV